MVIRVDGGPSPRQVGQDVDPAFADAEPPRLGVVSIRGERSVAEEVANIGLPGQQAAGCGCR